MLGQPYIPEYITVHLGPPGSDAENVTVSFPDYIKNVASSEIYPTWPEAAIRANIYAQISFALNRFYTEHYRSQGYDFDITNSTQFDQAFSPGREVFQNISDIVDDIFNSYVVRQGSVEPLFTAFCNGTTTICDGLSQWGSVDLAEQGLGPYDILTEYYGDDINLVTDAPVRIPSESFPGRPLRLGDINNDVRTLQVQLNRVSRNYPAIPKIYPVNGEFNKNTEDAVKEFQKIFNLTPDGIVGKATWYKLAYLFNGVKRLSELDSEGLTLSEISQQFPAVLQLGDTGNGVKIIQYYLAVISEFDSSVPPVNVTGDFDTATQNAVIAFQKQHNLTPDGIVGRNTYNELQRVYNGIRNTTTAIEGGARLYPGYNLALGSQGEEVRILQEYLSYISQTYTSIPTVPVTGVFGNQTDAAVKAFQTEFGLPPNGIVGPLTWIGIAQLYSILRTGNEKQPGQYPGTVLGEEEA